MQTLRSRGKEAGLDERRKVRLRGSPRTFAFKPIHLQYMSDAERIRAEVAAIRASQGRSAQNTQPPRPTSSRQPHAGRGAGPSVAGDRAQAPPPARSQESEFAMHLITLTDQRAALIANPSCTGSNTIQADSFKCLNPDAPQRPRGDRYFYRNKMKATKDKNGAALIRLCELMSLFAIVSHLTLPSLHS